jgi:hypothetical protein
MTTADPERCFTTMKRIKTILLSTVSEERLSALAMLSVGKNLPKSSSNTNEKVIEAFVLGKERRMTSLTNRLQVWVFSCCKFTLYYLFILLCVVKLF